MRFFIKLVATGLGLWIATLLPLQLSVTGGAEWWERVLVFGLVALVVVVLNEAIKPIVKILSIPLLILTLGLFYVVIVWFMLFLASWITGFLPFGTLTLGGFWITLVAAIVVSVVASIAEAMLAKATHTKRR